MKKLILLTLTLSFLFTGCGKTDIVTTAPTETTANTPTHTFEYVTFDAKVMKRTGDSLLLGDLGDTVGSIFWMSTDDASIKAGDTVEVTFNGMIMESYPPQLGDASLKFKEKGVSTLPMFEQVFLDLWNRDSGLNSGVNIIAVDLSGTNVLSDIEKEAFIRILDDYMYSNHDISVIASDYDRLIEEKMLVPYGDIENAYQFENGLLFTFPTKNETEKSFEFTPHKWRTPLGAYGFTIKAELKGGEWQGEWQYEIENEFIS